MLRGLLVSLAGALALAVPAAAGAASPNNTTATQAYVKANAALIRAAHSHLAAAEAVPKQVLHRLSAECPAVAAHSPQNVNSEHLSNEVIGVIVLEAAKLDASALRAFLKAATPLRWANHSLDRKITSYVHNLTVLSKLAVPNVCADLRTWAA